MPVQTRNECASPRGIGSSWTSTGTSGGLITRGVSVSGMDVPTACRHQQGGTTGNARVQSPAREYATDLGGQQWTALIQGEPEPAPTRYTNDPVCATDTTGWRSAGGSGARVTGLSGMVATTGYRVTASPAGAIGIGCQIIAVTPGENLTGTVQARPSVATNLTWYLSFYDSGGALVSRITGPVVAAAAGAAITRAVGGVAPAGAVTASVTVYTDSVASGATLIATGARIDGVDDATDMAFAATVSCAIELVFRDSSGVALSTIVSTEQVVATGTPVRCRAIGTAPFGTRRVQATFLARAVAAGALVHATAARLAAGDDSAMAYLDGESSGWLWDGTRYESTSGLPVAVTAPTESGTAAEVTGIAAALTPVIDSGGFLADTVTITATLPRLDTATATDSAGITAAGGIVDTASGADTARTTATPAVVDTGVGVDSAVASTSVSAVDSGQALDTVTVTRSTTIVDAATGQDTASTTAAVTALDGGTGADTAASGIAEVQRSATDTAAGADAAAVTASAQQTDTASGTDTAVVSSVGAVAPTDTATGGDTARITATLTAPTDTATGSDTAGTTAAATVLDSGAGADTARTTAAALLTDTATGLDGATVTAASVTVADAASGADSAAVTAASATVADTATSSDTASTTAAATRTDAGSGVDTATSSATVAATDASAGLDTASTAAGPARVDTATSTDSAAIAVDAAALDVGAGAESVAAVADVAALDAAGGTDSVVVTGVDSAVTDTATGLDELLVEVAPDGVIDAGAGLDEVLPVAAAVDLVEIVVVDEVVVLAAAAAALDAATGVDVARVIVDVVVHPVRARGPRPDRPAAHAAAAVPDRRPRATPRPTSS